MPASAPSRIAGAVQQRFGAALEVPRVSGLEALAVLNERSVCRRYRADPVPEEVVRLLCATALSAPTKSDLQQATIVRVANKEKRAAICALLPGSPWLAQAPELFVFCADGWRLRRLFAGTDLGNVIPPERVICQDEMVESVGAEAFQQRLWGMFGVSDIVRVMDLQQEQLERSMGEGHRVIHGVAGSGKTMLLGFRARRMAPSGCSPA